MHLKNRVQSDLNSNQPPSPTPPFFAWPSSAEQTLGPIISIPNAIPGSRVHACLVVFFLNDLYFLCCFHLVAFTHLFLVRWMETKPAPNVWGWGGRVIFFFATQSKRGGPLTHCFIHRFVKMKKLQISLAATASNIDCGWMHQSVRFEPAYKRTASSPLFPEQRCHCTTSLSHTCSSLHTCRSIYYGAGKGAEELRRIQVNSQPERFHDYSLFIPVVCPCCGVDSERDACLRERQELVLMSMLVVMRLGAAIHHTRETHSNRQQAGSISHSQDEKSFGWPLCFQRLL